MSLFCLCTSIAVFFNYILTITFLAPIVFIIAPFNNLTESSKNQKNNSNGILSSLNKSGDQQYCINNVNKNLLFKPEDIDNCQKDVNITATFDEDYTNEKFSRYNVDTESFTISRPFKYYSDFLNSTLGRIVALITMTCLLIISSIGIAQIKSTFEPSKAFPSDSQLANSLGEIRYSYYLIFKK